MRWFTGPSSRCRPSCSACGRRGEEGRVLQSQEAKCAIQLEAVHIPERCWDKTSRRSLRRAGKGVGAHRTTWAYVGGFRICALQVAQDCGGVLGRLQVHQHQVHRGCGHRRQRQRCKCVGAWARLLSNSCACRPRELRHLISLRHIASPASGTWSTLRMSPSKFMSTGTLPYAHAWSMRPATGLGAMRAYKDKWAPELVCRELKCVRGWAWAAQRSNQRGTCY